MLNAASLVVLGAAPRSMKSYYLVPTCTLDAPTTPHSSKPSRHPESARRGQLPVDFLRDSFRIIADLPMRHQRFPARRRATPRSTSPILPTISHRRDGFPVTLGLEYLAW